MLLEKFKFATNNNDLVEQKQNLFLATKSRNKNDFNIYKILSTPFKMKFLNRITERIQVMFSSIL
jgi:hypothetical protein